MREPGIRVLLVDDERELVDYLGKRLRKRGHEVVGVNSGKDALDQVKSQLFDVAVLDLKMPEMDGIELLTLLKEELPCLQAIMLTGHGSLDSALESGRQDAFRFLVKPYELQGLVETIREAYEDGRRHKKELFDAELQEAMTAFSTAPHELIRETTRLRKKYEQDR